MNPGGWGFGSQGGGGGSPPVPPFPIPGPNGSSLNILSFTELITILDAAFTDSTVDIPANAWIWVVSGIVVTAIPAAATFQVGSAPGAVDPAVPDLFATGVLIAGGTQFQSWKDAPGGGTLPYINGDARKVRITPDIVPAAATGQVRIVGWYAMVMPPTS